MQSEEFDKKIIDAAENHHPAYDENAWEKMEKLLDKHLPQKKDDKRRGIFFLLLFLLLGGSIAFLIINKPRQAKQLLSKEQSLIQEKNSNNKSENSIPEKVVQTAAPEIGDIRTSTTSNEKILLSSPVSKNKNILHGQTRHSDVFNNKISESDKTFSIAANNPTADVSKPSALINNTSENNKTTINQDPVTDLNTKNKISSKTVKENGITEKKSSTQNQEQSATDHKLENAESNKKDSSVFLNSSDISRKQSDKKKNTFFLSFSTAPDVSIAGSGKAGKLKFTYGAGLGFTYHNKFTLRTGFYTGRKIYSASPGEYHPPASFWSYYPNLENVDADCRVYEIPLLLSYNFGNSLKQNWFGTAGLSSYLMKRETYQYTYKNASGQYMYNDWTINNQNKHYFSVLTLSAGYQRNINQTFSLMVEPYLKIPLSGIGYGNVKLNSAGLLFSAAIKPFGTNSKIRKTKSSGTN